MSARSSARFFGSVLIVNVMVLLMALIHHVADGFGASWGPNVRYSASTSTSTSIGTPQIPWTGTATMPIPLTMTTSNNNVNYPMKIKSVISKLTASTQKALQDRRSRMEIELPPAVSFGVETAASKATNEPPNADKIRKSNREAARLLTEMFSVLSATTVVLFPSEEEAFGARTMWGPAFRGKTFAMDSKGGSSGMGMGKMRRRMTLEEKEQALFGGSDGLYIPDGSEVVIIAGPRAKDMKKIKALSEKLGDETLIILLNARISAILQRGADSSSTDNSFPDLLQNAAWLQDMFVNAFHYAPPAVAADDGGSLDKELLLFHEYGSHWFLAEKASNSKSFLGLGLGDSTKFTTIWEGKIRPSGDDVKQALAKSADAS